MEYSEGYGRRKADRRPVGRDMKEKVCTSSNVTAALSQLNNKCAQYLKNYNQEEINSDRTVHVLPYCNETLSTFDFLDNVNRPVLPAEGVEALEKHLPVNISFHGMNPRNGHVRGPTSNPRSFLEYFNKFATAHKNIQQFVVVTHSKFLQRFVRTWFPNREKVYFDNLDVLTIKINKTTQKIESGCALRWPTYGGGSHAESPGLASSSQTITLIFIRHCQACHNHPSATLWDKFWYKGSGVLSMCLDNTVDEVALACAGHLSALLYPRHIKTSEVLFCSSVLFRGVVTASILQRLAKTGANNEVDIHTNDRHRPSLLSKDGESPQDLSNNRIIRTNHPEDSEYSEDLKHSGDTPPEAYPILLPDRSNHSYVHTSSLLDEIQNATVTKTKTIRTNDPEDSEDLKHSGNTSSLLNEIRNATLTTKKSRLGARRCPQNQIKLLRDCYRLDKKKGDCATKMEQSLCEFGDSFQSSSSDSGSDGEEWD